jgi:hypothetical protein
LRGCGDCGLCFLLVRDVASHEGGAIAKLGRELFALVGVDVGDRDVRATLVERAHGRLAETRRPAGHNRACIL